MGNGVVAVVAVVVHRLTAKKLLHLKNLGVVAVVVPLLIVISYMKDEHGGRDDSTKCIYGEKILVSV